LRGFDRANGKGRAVGRAPILWRATLVNGAEVRAAVAQMSVRNLLVLALLGAVCCYGVFLFADETVRYLGEEDGL